MKKLLLALLVLGIVFCLTTCRKDPFEAFELKNASFEGLPASSTISEEWTDCGTPTETPPDIQPGAFEVTTPAQEGNTYLGMVVRDNHTWEAVGQQLAEPLRKGNQYELRVFLARSDEYFGGSATTEEDVYFTQPAVLRVWGSNDRGDNLELLAETPPVQHEQWKEYTLNLQPAVANQYNYIKLEAYYQSGAADYNGNILLDNCSLEKID